PAGYHSGVQLGLHHHPTADDVQPTGEPQGGRHLGLAFGHLGDADPTQLVLDGRRHRHGVVSLFLFVSCSCPSRSPAVGSGATTRPTLSSTRASAAASGTGSCRGLPSSAATAASSTRAPNRSAAAASRLREPAASLSAST